MRGWQDEPGETEGARPVAGGAGDRGRIEAALKASQERLDALIRAVPGVVWEAWGEPSAADQRIDFVSDHVEAMLGYTVDEWLAEPNFWLKITHPDDREGAARVATEAFLAGEPHANQFRWLARDGRVVWTEAHAVTIRDAAGRPVGMRGVNIDITARKRAEAALAAQYEREHRIAETLQRALLLKSPPGAFPGLEVEAHHRAALDEAAVGGDFFDSFAVADGQVALVVGDVSGKGLAAAAHTAEVKYALRTFLAEYPEPAIALMRANEFLCDTRQWERRDGESFVAAAVAVADPATGRVKIACAGIEPPLVVRANAGGRGGYEVSPPGGLPLGIVAGEPYEHHEGVLGPGDILLMATDGLAEARRPSGGGSDFLGTDGLARLAAAEIAAAAVPGGDLGALGDRLLARVEAFSGGALHDDACLLLARRRNSPEP